MKTSILFRTILIASALVFSMLTSYGQEDPAKKLVGTWTKVHEMQKITFTITADNKTQVEFTGDSVIDVYSSYKISGKQITFNDEAGDYAANVPGVYEFKVDDSSLTLTVVDDPVQGRSMLVKGTWSKVKE
jgi:hypothetical protein